MKHAKHILPLGVLIFLWGFLALFVWLKPADDFSESERRKLASMPEPGLDSVMSGKFFRDFENYSLDQFPLRDHFRTLKAVSEFGLFRKKDNNDIYIADGHAVKMEYPLNEKSVENAVEKMNELYELFLAKRAASEGTVKDPENDSKPEVSGRAAASTHVYLAIVPDKGYFLSEKTGHPALDYDKLFEMVQNEMPYAEYIDLTSTLDADDYYQTDSHWKQENLTTTAQTLADAMHSSISGDYEIHTVSRPFYGVYYGQAALPLAPDKLRYLTNDTLDNCTVYNAETPETTGLYDLVKLESRDMYEVYLSGASPLLTITNPKAASGKELIVFRDSFASSLVPLLAEGYAKITLIDTRYIQPELIGEYVDFGGRRQNYDILFLYSTTLLNNSEVLR